MPSKFAFTPPSSMVEREKENTNHGNQIGASPPTSSSSNSLFKNLLNSFSPLKVGFGTFSPFKNSIINSSEAAKNEVKRQSNFLEISDDHIGDPELCDLIQFCRKLCRNSFFVKKTAQLIKKRTESVQIAHSQLPIESFLLPRLAPTKGHHPSLRLETIIIAKKHVLSHQFQTTTIPYSPKGGKQFAFSGDSLTFEFFNTIAPFFPGSTFANIDVFLCGINSEEEKLHFWDYLFNFTSAVNQKKRQNRVQEIWVPKLADCCDELLIVVEGRIMENEDYFLNGEGGMKLLGKRKSMPNSYRTNIINPMKMGRKRGGGNEEIGGGEKMMAKRRKTVDLMSEIELMKAPGEKSPKSSPMKNAISKQPLMVFRGLKSIAKWKKDEKDAKEGILNGKKAHFQPFYTHNGIILNIFGTDEPKLLDETMANIPDYEFIEALNNRTKNGARETCQMIQMEISNENGFGGNLEEIGNYRKSLKNRQKTNIQREIGKKCCQQEIFYNFGKSTSSPKATLNFLKLLPMAKQPFSCIICVNIHFWHIWELSLHFVNIHPSLQFDFFLPSSSNNDNSIKICIDVLAATSSNGKICKKNNFLLNCSATNLLRKNILFGELNGSRKGENKEREDKNGQEANNIGKIFNGILPFKEPIYTPLDSTPFPNLFGVECDRGWIRDSFGQRLNQFTDVTAKEKEFFALWNSFIGQRANRVLGVHLLPKLLTDFMDKFGEELAKNGLLSNLIEHCAVLKKFGYIDGPQMVDCLLYGEAKNAKWRK